MSNCIFRQQTLPQSLFAHVDIAMLAYFRIVFGLTIYSWASTALLTGKVDGYYVQPRFHFTYPGLGWIEPLSGMGMHWLFLVLVGCAILVVLGLCYRLASILLASGFTYVFLIDAVCYQNHYYLLCLICWIMAFVPAHRACSLDARWHAGLRSEIAPAWSLAWLRFQIAVPYFYGGVAKLSGDWLRGQPMRSALAERADLPLFGPLLAHQWATWFFSYGGLFFDLLVVPALCWRRTRPWAFGLAVAFHLTNASLFPIGVFPWFMILATVIFFPADFPRQLCKALGRFRLAVVGNIFRCRDGDATTSKDVQTPCSPPKMTTSRQWGAALLAGYVLIQLVLPLRHLAYSGNVNWTEEGHRFSWHMMLRGKRFGIRYYAYDPETSSTWPVNLRPYLTEYQVTRYGRDPQMIRQLGHFIAADLRRQAYPRIRIQVLALVSLNGRKPQMLIDPRFNLAAQNSTPWWKQPDWILPLEEPFRWHGWDVPLEQWEQHVVPPASLGSENSTRE